VGRLKDVSNQRLVAADPVEVRAGCQVPPLGHVPARKQEPAIRNDDAVCDRLIEDLEVLADKCLPVAEDAGDDKARKIAVVSQCLGNIVGHAGCREFAVAVDTCKAGICLELAFEPDEVVVHHDGCLGQVLPAGAEIAEKVGGVAHKIGGFHLGSHPEPEPYARPQHCVAEDRGSGYAVGIVVCEHFHELLPFDLLCNDPCCGFKRHGYPDD
jgi:hypothetical protein